MTLIFYVALRTTAGLKKRFTGGWSGYFPSNVLFMSLVVIALKSYWFGCLGVFLFAWLAKTLSVLAFIIA
jgi:hypothetical protein